MAATESAAMTVVLRCQGRDDVCSAATSINSARRPGRSAYSSRSVTCGILMRLP